MTVNKNKINAAIQLLPGIEKKQAYALVDEAITLIRNSGMKHRVCPFETVVEGDYQSITDLIARIRNRAYESGAQDLIINVKFQFGANKDVLIEDKMSKYE
jgi:uncharacterized protein YqgV (UPF0045/DUF77 family)